MTGKLFKDSPKPFKLKENSESSVDFKSDLELITTEISKTDTIVSDHQEKSKTTGK